MLFNSFVFLVFFTLVLFVSRAIASWSGRKLFLLLVSYVFYAAWNPPFVVLLWISTLVDWFVARAMDRTDHAGRRRGLLILTLVVNLGLLSFFKYGTFVLDNVTVLLNALGIAFSPRQPDIFLPVGISFYTFQTLSYTIDVYRRRSRPWAPFLDYALYVTFFPQLVAGPIVRASEFLPQCAEPRRASWVQINWGLTLMVIGLFAKVVIADVFMAPVADGVYSGAIALTPVSAWIGTLAFAVQIYCDFFGYSTCAVGAALCLGFALPDNFRYPYAAVGFSDFWRRWHISLSTWLRDYLYIALGGSRRGSVRTVVNLMATMLLGGLWHGASWMFVIWGGLHGSYLIAERALRASSLAAWAGWRTEGGRFVLSLMTFVLVCVAWVYFRAESLTDAWAMSCAMVGVVDAAAGAGAVALSLDALLMVLALTLATLALHQRLRESSLEAAFGRMPWPWRSVIIAALAFLILISMTGEDRAFIYFQF